MCQPVVMADTDRSRTLHVDGETWEVTVDERGQHSFHWLTGIAEGYGFASMPSHPGVARSEAEMTEQIREFMSNVDPETGHLADLASRQVRRLDVAEWSVALDLRVAALTDVPEVFGSTVARERGLGPDAWRARLTDNAWFAGFVDDDAAGLACGVRTSSPRTVELTGVWVAPQQRGSGLADELVLAVLSWARAEGAQRVELEVVANNQHAIDLYARHGFESVAAAGPRWADLGEGDIVMAADIGDAERL